MSDASPKCNHRIPGRISTQDAVGCTPDDSAVIHVARHFFRTFSAPQSQAWMQAFAFADTAFAGREPAVVTLAILKAVQSMGAARRSGFNFAAFDCDICSPKLTEHERQFVSVIMDLRRGRKGCAHVNAMMLCEGNDLTSFLSAMRELLTLLEPRSRQPEAALANNSSE